MKSNSEGVKLNMAIFQLLDNHEIVSSGNLIPFSLDGIEQLLKENGISNDFEVLKSKINFDELIKSEDLKSFFRKYRVHKLEDLKTKVDKPVNIIESPFTYVLQRQNDLISRDKELTLMQIILHKSRRSNILLVGEPGVGKTALVAELSNSIKIIGLDLISLTEGTTYRGSFEKRLKLVLRYIEENSITLFIDEIHALNSLGNAEGGINIKDVLKPVMSNGNISIIGATTNSELRILKADKAFIRRFNILEVLPIKEDSILNNLDKIIEEVSIDHTSSIDRSASVAVLKKLVQDGTTYRLLDSFIDHLDTILSIAEFKQINKIDMNNYLRINDVLDSMKEINIEDF